MQLRLLDGYTLRFYSAHQDGGLDVQFQRSLRLPEEGPEMPWPPGLNLFPLALDEEGLWIPMRACEALEIQLCGRAWHPNAVRVGVGNRNAVTGKTWRNALQGYLVCPPDNCLEGYERPGRARGQFGLATPELQLQVFEPRRERVGIQQAGVHLLQEANAEEVLQHLLRQGLITEKGYRNLLRRSYPLTLLKGAARREALNWLAGLWGVPFEDLAGWKPPSDWRQEIPEATACSLVVLGLGTDGSALRVAVGHPALGNRLSQVLGRPLRPLLADPALIQKHLESLYGDCVVQVDGPESSGLSPAGGRREREAWSRANPGQISVHLVPVSQWEARVGRTAPPTPITPSIYARQGLPWLPEYEESNMEEPPATAP